VTVMAIGTKKAVIGVVATIAFFAILVPSAFWWLTVLIDNLTALPPIPLPTQICLILAASSILVGAFWITWAHSYLVFVGKGLPLEAFGRALHPTQILVTTGPYAYTRNPMLLGALFVLLGIAFLRRSLGGVVLIPVLTGIAAAYLIAFEEKGLVRRFGEEYKRYRETVPMLLPSLRRRTKTMLASNHTNQSDVKS